MTAQYAHPDSLVDTQWVTDHLGKAGVVLAEVDVDTSAYDSGHIEGSLGWNWQTDLQNTVTRDLLTSDEVAEPSRQLRHFERHDDRPLRRQQQLVRRLGVLVPADVRPSGR